MADLDQTLVSRAVLIEVANVLGAYRDRLVLIGGWVPELLYPNRGHIRSLDVDFAVAPTDFAENAYESIRTRLLEAGYSCHSGPACFSKSVAGAAKPVKVDFICGQYLEGEKSAGVRINDWGFAILGCKISFIVWFCYRCVQAQGVALLA